MKRFVFIVSLFLFCINIYANDLYIGVLQTDITPKLPIALMGQFYLRIAHEINTPLTANIIALESRNGSRGLDTAIFVSCDLEYMPNQIWNRVRNEVSKNIPGFSVDKIILNATHSHTSPVLEDVNDQAPFYYDVPEKGVTQVEEYRKFIVDRIGNAIVDAWNKRVKGQMSWGVRRASIPYNRRVVYKDGTAAMYGKTDIPGFNNVEGYEDHDIHSLFFWNSSDELLGMAIEVACPAQENEHDNGVDADYWHLVRESLNEFHGDQIVIAAWIGAAGDQSPRPIYRKKADERMRKLSNVDRMEDIAQRIISAVNWTYEVVEKDKHQDVILDHRVRNIELPRQKISEKDYIEAKRIANLTAQQIANDPAKSIRSFARMIWYGDVVKRYEDQKTKPNLQYETEIHVVRLGDVVVCTNQFELFTDYGIQMQSRSKALQTIVVQLAGPGTYLPSSKAVKGGGYSAIIQSNEVGPEGGAILVEETLDLINAMWDD